MVSWPAIGRQHVSRPGWMAGRVPTQCHEDSDLLLAQLRTGLEPADLGLLSLSRASPSVAHRKMLAAGKAVRPYHSVVLVQLYDIK